MDYRLDRDEKFVCREIAELGLGQHIFYLNDYFEEFISVALFVETTLPLLIAYDFVVFKNFTISKKEAPYIEDIFLKKFHKLIIENKLDQASKYAKEFDVDALSLLAFDKFTLNDFSSIYHGQLHSLGVGAHFDYDLITLMALNIEVKQGLLDFIHSLPEDEEFSEQKEPEYTDIAVFDENENQIRYHSSVCKIRKFSKQKELLKVVFEDPNKDWQFSEIAEKIDPLENFNWKRLHSVALAIGTKIATTIAIKDFFETTSQSVKINPKYLKKKESPGFDDF